MLLVLRDRMVDLRNSVASLYPEEFGGGGGDAVRDEGTDYGSSGKNGTSYGNGGAGGLCGLVSGRSPTKGDDGWVYIEYGGDI